MKRLLFFALAPLYLVVGLFYLYTAPIMEDIIKESDNKIIVGLALIFYYPFYFMAVIFFDATFDWYQRLIR